VKRSTNSSETRSSGAALGDHVFGHYVEAKRAEWDEYRTQVSDWEVDRYLDQF
jgi:glutamine synthetase